MDIDGHIMDIVHFVHRHLRWTDMDICLEDMSIVHMSKKEKESLKDVPLAL